METTMETIKANIVTEFMCNVIYLEAPMPLNFRLSIGIELLGSDEDPSLNENNIISAQRISFFIENVLNGILIVDGEHPILEYFLSREHLVSHMMMPTTPTDVIVGKALYCKLNAIVAKTVKVTSVTIGSGVLPDVIITDDSDFSVVNGVAIGERNGEKIEMEPWMLRDDLATFNAILVNIDNGEQDQFNGYANWEDIGLEWVDEEIVENPIIIDEEKSDGNVIYTSVFPQKPANQDDDTS